MTDTTGAADTVAPNATAQGERAALSDLLLAVGPDAPTLCTGWTARDLAAHLVIRERRLDAAAGIIISPLAGWTARVQSGEAAREFPELVERVRQGPPGWSVQSKARIDGQTNTVEFFVHHEDVRRAQPDWSPRELSVATVTQLWNAIARNGRFLLRKSPVGVVVRPTDGRSAGQEVRLRDGESTVTLAGPVGEIVLSIYGRLTAGLTLEGDATNVSAFTSFAR